MRDDWDEGGDDDEEDDLGPGDADYDLSEEHGYSWEPRREHWPVPPLVIALVSILVVIALVAPGLFIVLRER
jgi:hypothetical protein